MCGNSPENLRERERGAGVNLGWMNWPQSSSYKGFLLSEANDRGTVPSIVPWRQPQRARNHETPRGRPLPTWPRDATAAGRVPSGPCLWQEDGRRCYEKSHVSSTGRSDPRATHPSCVSSCGVKAMPQL